jgi:DNA repair exonuclease SbcCD nuclease subunit
MKISIIPDVHCGYGKGTPREEDAFLALDEAVEKNLDSDLILMVGDIFDSRIPKQETIAKVAKSLVKAQNVPSKTQFVDIIGKDRKELSPSSLRGIPIVSLHGNHDRRSKHMTNPVQLLEKAGVLIHLHKGVIIFEIENKKVAIHGMGNVPERYAKDSLYNWNPKPVEGAINILLLHQSIDPYIYSPLEPPSIKLEDLPAGFDLIIDGHMHWHDTRTLGGCLLLISGSLSPTSIHKKESEQRKGYFVYNGMTLEFKGIDHQRKIHNESLYFNDNIIYDLDSKISGIVSRNTGKLKPIIKINIKGIIPKSSHRPSFMAIENKYKDKAIIKIGRNFKSEDFEEQIELLRALREKRLSPEEQGVLLLRKNLEQTKCEIRPDELFDILMDGDTDKAMNILNK